MLISKKLLWLVLPLMVISAAIFSVLHAEDPDCSMSTPPSAKEGVLDKATVMMKMSYYCSAYSACSIDRDLRGATLAELKEYEKEKKMDGKTFENRVAPDFQAIGSDGTTVSLSQFRGQPVALVFLAVHCNHSKDTLPHLSQLKKEYESQGLHVLPLYVHDGTVEDLKEFAMALKLDFPLYMVGQDVSLLYGNRMVPTVFLVDRNGHIRQQFVGYKTQSVLQKAVAEFLRKNSEDSKQIGVIL